MSSFVFNCFSGVEISNSSAVEAFPELVLSAIFKLTFCVLVFATLEDFDSVVSVVFCGLDVVFCVLDVVFWVLDDAHLEALIVDVLGGSEDGIGDGLMDSSNIFKPAMHVLQFPAQSFKEVLKTLL